MAVNAMKIREDSVRRTKSVTMIHSSHAKKIVSNMEL